MDAQTTSEPGSQGNRAFLKTSTSANRMTRRIAIIVAPLFLLALTELLFRLGVWEPLATPLSHAGTSVRLKRNLLDPSLSKIDFVTLGSSRPEYGIDHERINALAREHGYVHANLSMPGSHWMTIGVMTDWLRQHHPEIRGGIIALSSQSLGWPSNGAYELGIVEPFRTVAESNWVAEHIPLDSANVETWGSRFSLFAWREDVRDFLTHPISRLNRFAVRSVKAETSQLFSNPELAGAMCAWGLQDLSACARLDGDLTAPENLRQQCRQVTETIHDRPDFGALMEQSPLPIFMQQTRDLVQRQLRGIRWSTRPIVLLMPTPPIWRTDVHGEGLQQWALSVLKPLDEEGTIKLIDATGFFDGSAGKGCQTFGDFYHQNAQGRKQFSDWLIPQLETMLYAHRAQPDS